MKRGEWLNMGPYHHFQNLAVPLRSSLKKSSEFIIIRLNDVLYKVYLTHLLLNMSTVLQQIGFRRSEIGFVNPYMNKIETE